MIRIHYADVSIHVLGSSGSLHVCEIAFIQVVWLEGGMNELVAMP